MKDEIETAVKELADKAKKAEKAGEAQQYAQAAMSLAYAFAMMEGTKK